MPDKFSGDDAQQNERVQAWVNEVNRYLRLSKIPVEDHLDYARTLFSSKGSASDWVDQREEEVTALGRTLTWEWLQRQLVEHYAQTSGEAAMEAEWMALAMGVRSADGSDTGKSTRSVASYTRRFLHYLRRLTDETVQTSSVLVIDRYLLGIRRGYEVLWRAMLGGRIVMRFATLQDAISEAEIAESDLAAAKSGATSNSSLPSRFLGGHAWGTGGARAPTESLNSLEGETSDRDEGNEGAAAKPKAQLYGFRFLTLPSDGRHVLTEAEQRMLYEQKRCYRCYGQHPVGVGKPACTKPLKKEAPRALSKN